MKREVGQDGELVLRGLLYLEYVAEMRDSEELRELRPDLRCVAVGGLLAADYEVEAADGPDPLGERPTGRQDVGSRETAIGEHAPSSAPII
jgi:hypothetical protein